MAVSLKSLGIERLGTDDNEVMPVTATQRHEIDRRLAEHNATPDDVVSWDEVKASLEKRLKAGH